MDLESPGRKTDRLIIYSGVQTQMPPKVRSGVLGVFYYMRNIEIY